MRLVGLTLALFCTTALLGCDRSQRTQLPKDGAITFGEERIGAGTVLTRDARGTFDGRARVGARHLRVSMTTEEIQREKILQTDGPKPVKLEVTYLRSRTTTNSRIDGRVTESDSVEGKAYRVTRGSTPRVRLAGGGKPTLEESLELAGDYTLASHPLDDLDTLRGTTVRYGETIPSASFAVLDFQNPRATARLVDTWMRDGRPVAVFTFEMEGDEQGGEYELEGVAEFDIRTGALLSMLARGPMTYKEPGAKVKGEIELEITHTYDWAGRR